MVVGRINIIRALRFVIETTIDGSTFCFPVGLWSSSETASWQPGAELVDTASMVDDRVGGNRAICFTGVEWMPVW